MPKLASNTHSIRRQQPDRKTRAKTLKTTRTKKTTSKPKSAKSAKPQTGQEQDASTPIFFWKPHQPWGFFSQWYMAPFTDNTTGMTFVCNEQYMMYHKALTFKDSATAAKILATSSPREHKALGKKVWGFTEEVWGEVKFEIVVKANMLKFRQGRVLSDDGLEYMLDGQTDGQKIETLRELLMSTGERELVEASALDRIWGIGYGPTRAGSVPRAKWGKNLLGKALMEVRKTLRDEEVGGATVEVTKEE